MYILNKFRTFSRSLKSLSQFNTFNTAWNPACYGARKGSRPPGNLLTSPWGGVLTFEPLYLGLQETR